MIDFIKLHWMISDRNPLLCCGGDGDDDADNENDSTGLEGFESPSDPEVSAEAVADWVAENSSSTGLEGFENNPEALADWQELVDTINGVDTSQSDHVNGPDFGGFGSQSDPFEIDWGNVDLTNVGMPVQDPFGNLDPNKDQDRPSFSPTPTFNPNPSPFPSAPAQNPFSMFGVPAGLPGMWGRGALDFSALQNPFAPNIQDIQQPGVPGQPGTPPAAPQTQVAGLGFDGRWGGVNDPTSIPGPDLDMFGQTQGNPAMGATFPSPQDFAVFDQPERGGPAGRDIGVNFPGQTTGLEGFGVGGRGFAGLGINFPGQTSGLEGLERSAPGQQAIADMFGRDFNFELGPTHQSPSPGRTSLSHLGLEPIGPTDNFGSRWSFANPTAQAAPQQQQQVASVPMPPSDPRGGPFGPPTASLTVNPASQPSPGAPGQGPPSPSGNPSASPSFGGRGSFPAPPGVQDIGAPGMGFDPTASYAGFLDPRLMHVLNMRGHDNDGAISQSFLDYTNEQFPAPPWGGRTRMDAHGQVGLVGMGQPGDTGIANTLFAPHRFTGADGTAMQHPAPWDDRMAMFGATNPNPPDLGRVSQGDIGTANLANFQRILEDWERARAQATPDLHGQWPGAMFG
jgi:hypothetical protein